MGAMSIAIAPLLVIFACLLTEHRLSQSKHPIDTMIAKATKTFDQILSHETRVCSDAVAAYKARRGRDPPPGFTRWFQLAQNLNATVVEQFWDAIYEDLDVFWEIPPSQVQSQIQNTVENAQSLDISIFQLEDGNVKNGCGDDQFCPEFNDMFRQVADLGVDFLPAVTLAVNRLITPRIFIPYEATRQRSRIYYNVSVQEGDSLGDIGKCTL